MVLVLMTQTALDIIEGTVKQASNPCWFIPQPLQEVPAEMHNWLKDICYIHVLDIDGAPGQHL